jgi:Phytanoyl-CoA dioxygenase (PhyH)
MNPEDLSVYHHPITPLFPQIFRSEDCDRYRLNDDQTRFFKENGYLAGLRILHEAEIERLLEELQDLINPGDPGNGLFYEFHSNESADPAKVVFHALGAWRIKPGFHDLLWHPAYLIPASQLLGGAVRFWHDQLFCKPAYHGGIVAWHQDYSYWTRTTPLAHLTCWIGLDDTTHDNGCVRYVPGSHLWPDLPITGLTGDMDAIQSVLSDEQKARFNPVAMELKKGECTFHHPRMIHGSYGNTTGGQRRATVINVFRDGVRSNSDAQPLKGVPVIPKGQKMGGQFFPLLFEPDR